jgi:hypothetical protein
MMSADRWRMYDEPTSSEKERRRIRSDLVNVLERTRLMRSPDSRQLMLDHLRERLGPQLQLRELSELRLQVVDIVNACTGLPHAVLTLVEVVEYLEPATREVMDLWRLRDEWEVTDVLRAEDWSELRPAIETLTLPNLAWLYQQATDNRQPGPPRWCANPWHAFVHLAGLNAGPNGLPPSAIFLMLLTPKVDADTAEWIRNRNGRQADEDGFTEELNQQSRITVQDQSVDATAYLVIQLAPLFDPEDADSAREQFYMLSYCRQWRDGKSWRSQQGDSRPVPNARVERTVEEVIKHVETIWERAAPVLTVEFVLPWELLNTHVEWWEKEFASGQPTPLTMDYPVVVRSLERLRTPWWHNAWRHRWRQLQTAPASSRVHWSRPAGEDYFTRLENLLKSDDQVVSLVLSEPPRADGRIGRQEVEAALRAGLPAIIWHRYDCTSAAFREAVTRLISDRGLAKLPLRAKELRRVALDLEPSKRKDHVGRHLTVLWCDPDRKPDRLVEETR